MDETEQDDSEYEAFVAELEGKSVQDILREGQKALFIQLVARTRTSKASHQELAVLRNVLKDNGLTLGIPPERPAEDSHHVPADLPDFQDPEYLQ